MTREETISVLENEKKCVLRDSCERSECASCDLVMPIERILSAYDMSIAALREQEIRRWIPTTERMPENIGMYLVIEKHWLDGSPGIKIAKWNTVDWFTADRKSNEITPRVTHWMPLPELPKWRRQLAMGSPGLWLHGDDGPELICGDYIKNPFDFDLQRLVDEIHTAGDTIISGEKIYRSNERGRANETIQDY